MKQIELALHNYHNVYNALPALNGEVKFGDGSVDLYYGIFFHLLPFYEGQNRYDGVINSATRIIPSAPSEYVQGSIPTLLCPSDPESRNPGLSFDVDASGNRIPTNAARNNLVACLGDHLAVNNKAIGKYASIHFGVPRAPFHVSVTTNDGDAAAPASNVWKNFESITDGLSNTLAFSETVSSVQASGSVDPRLFVVGLALNASETFPYSVSPLDCQNHALDSGNRSLLSAAAVSATKGNVFRGHNFAQGLPPRVGFNTSLPPNSPSCNNRNNAVNPELGWGLYSAGSYHVGGVNTAFFDGSVRFISEAINSEHPELIVTHTGASPYGIWGALATINCGESVSF
jgi:prepilin-type processing-associated H-X9-DG protein